MARLSHVYGFEGNANGSNERVVRRRRKGDGEAPDSGENGGLIARWSALLTAWGHGVVSRMSTDGAGWKNESQRPRTWDGGRLTLN